MKPSSRLVSPSKDGREHNFHQTVSLIPSGSDNYLIPNNLSHPHWGVQSPSSSPSRVTTVLGGLPYQWQNNGGDGGGVSVSGDRACGSASGDGERPLHVPTDPDKAPKGGTMGPESQSHPPGGPILQGPIQKSTGTLDPSDDRLIGITIIEDTSNEPTGFIGTDTHHKGDEHLVECTQAVDVGGERGEAVLSRETLNLWDGNGYVYVVGVMLPCVSGDALAELQVNGAEYVPGMFPLMRFFPNH